jgi:adenine-specific DNA-methyltransferase
LARRLKKRGAASIEATRHTGDRRSNIPTAELEGFTEDAEKAPKEVLYPRDSSLDPQLVWKGKDEQDQQDLAVPAVPVYIQEKISPQALVEDLRRESNVAPDTEQINLFSDFNGLPFERLVEFYEHDQQWTNRMILGDSLLAMTSLAEKEGLRGKVQMIYIDPPYGVKFGSNWQVSTRKREVRDGKAEDATRQPEQIKAFRDTWDLGIHSYLTYLRDRFATASDLLSESGSIFVQIGDENVHLVRSLMDEIFGSDNFCLSIAYKKTTGAGSPAVRTDLPPAVFDYLLWYAKDRQTMKYRQLFDSKVQGGEGTGQYRWIETESGRRPASAAELIAPNARLFRYDNLTSQTAGQTTVFPVDFAGQTFVPAKGGWKTNAAGMANLRAAGRLLAAGQTLCYLRYLDDFPARPRSNLWDDTVTSGFGEPKVFVVQTHPRVLERCILMTTDPGDLVLDPTCGSGTTAYVAEQWGRRWITLDTSRVAVALARTRLMTARYPYYLLADSDAGVLKEAERAGQPVPSPMPNSTGDVKKGFLYERVPHVTLKSIANNPEIEDDMAPDEIDAAITRHAESELLYDKPAVAPARCVSAVPSRSRACRRTG